MTAKQDSSDHILDAILSVIEKDNKVFERVPFVKKRPEPSFSTIGSTTSVASTPEPSVLSADDMKKLEESLNSISKKRILEILELGSREDEVNEEVVPPMVESDVPMRLEQIAKDPDRTSQFNKLLQDTEQPVWALCTPSKFPVADATEAFKTKHHIGGEEFKVAGIRAGKRGPLVVLTPARPDTYVLAEVPLSNVEHLFGHGMMKWLQAKAQLVNIPQKEVLSGMPDVLDEERVKKYDDFGSW